MYVTEIRMGFYISKIDDDNETFLALHLHFVSFAGSPIKILGIVTTGHCFERVADFKRNYRNEKKLFM